MTQPYSRSSLVGKLGYSQKRNNPAHPVIAFDLVQEPGRRAGDYTIGSFCSDLLATAVGSTDTLIRRLLPADYYVPVPLSKEVDSLDFEISVEQRQRLFRIGYRAANDFFNRFSQWSEVRNPVEQLQFSQWSEVRNPVEQLQALFLPPRLVVPVLRAVAMDFEASTGSKNVRAYIMLPIDSDTAIVVYQYGMDNDADVDLELALTAGVSGAAWSYRTPMYADLEHRKQNSSMGGMAEPERNKVKADRRAMLSVPIFAGRPRQFLEASTGEQVSSQGPTIDDFGRVGILSVDSDTALVDTGWAEPGAINLAKRWADVLATMLARGNDV